MARRKFAFVQQLSHSLTCCIDNVTKQFKTLRQKKFWRSIKSLSTFDRLLPFVDPSVSGICLEKSIFCYDHACLTQTLFWSVKKQLPSINVLSVDDRVDYCCSVYHSTSTVYGFCLNPSMRDTMAICMKSEIQEIDLTKATDNTGAPLIRARSVSSFGLGPDHHVDSYPDTEEDDSDFEDSESLHAAKQTRRNRFPSSSKISSNNSPIVSPAGSRTFDEHVQRGLQNLNLDYLQDSLKKSFPKGAEAGRTPAASSPAVFDQAERESMISLRRPVTASCMETHPHYPFCKR
ncbi:hypothetical protein EDC96DRAFT_442291 [Choanephora cucurbitarum]|nr:hypothetical protein EDC96DRAFT_442291 [Choanephora cucurbitarum]